MKYLGFGVSVAVAAGIAYVATRAAGPVQLTQYTEQREGPLLEHLVTAAELLTQPVYTPHRYPTEVATGVSQCVTHGFAPLYKVPDPQVAALPAEVMW